MAHWGWVGCVSAGLYALCHPFRDYSDRTTYSGQACVAARAVNPHVGLVQIFLLGFIDIGKLHRARPTLLICDIGNGLYIANFHLCFCQFGPWRTNQTCAYHFDRIRHDWRVDHFMALW